MKRNIASNATAISMTKCGASGEVKVKVSITAVVATAQFVVASIRCRHTSMCPTTAR
jgi:hypothetical protein